MLPGNREGQVKEVQLGCSGVLWGARGGALQGARVEGRASRCAPENLQAESGHPLSCSETPCLPSPCPLA